MEFYVTEDPIIKCSNCGQKNKISIDDLDYDSYFIGKYNMGERFEHVFGYEGICGCCGTRFSFSIKGDEYPVGALEYQYSEADGCEIVFEPAIAVNYIGYDIPEEYEDIIASSVGELIEQIRRDYSVVYQITSRQFEELVAELFVEKGYDVTLTPARNDGGKDIIAKRNDDGIPICLYIECKQYDINNPVGVSIVRSASGVRAHDKVNKAIIVTTSRFTRGAFKYANEENHLIQLMSLNELL